MLRLQSGKSILDKSKEIPRHIAENPLIVALAVLLITALMVPGIISRAEAQQTDADFSAYCRANFNNGTYQRFAQSWSTEHACVQGGTRQGIDLAQACYLTTGNRNYEISGTRVLCQGSAGDAPVASANDLGEPDFSRYCRENFANSAYEQRAASNGINHYCRRPGATGGFTLQPVDLAAACRSSQATSSYRIDGARVFCTMENVTGGNAGNAGAGAGGGSMVVMVVVAAVVAAVAAVAGKVRTRRLPMAPRPQAILPAQPILTNPISAAPVRRLAASGTATPWRWSMQSKRK